MGPLQQIPDSSDLKMQRMPLGNRQHIFKPKAALPQKQILSRQTTLPAIHDITVLFAAMNNDLLLTLLENLEVNVHLAISIMLYKHVVQCSNPFFHIFMTICHKPVSL